MSNRKRPPPNQSLIAAKEEAHGEISVVDRGAFSDEPLHLCKVSDHCRRADCLLCVAYAANQAKETSVDQLRWTNFAHLQEVRHGENPGFYLSLGSLTGRFRLVGEKPAF